MDILHLVDRLEEEIKKGRKLPFGDSHLVEESRIWPILDQMRISIPDEVRRAERIIREKDRIVAQAQEEAERIIELARNEAAEITADHKIATAAEERAKSIKRRAEREAESIRAGADEYAFDTLCQMEQELKRVLTIIENGIQTLEAKKEERRAPATPPQGERVEKTEP